LSSASAKVDSPEPDEPAKEAILGTIARALLSRQRMEGQRWTGGNHDPRTLQRPQLFGFRRPPVEGPARIECWFRETGEVPEEDFRSHQITGRHPNMNGLSDFVQSDQGTPPLVHVLNASMEADIPAPMSKRGCLPSQAATATICGQLDTCIPVGLPAAVLNRFTQESHT
jgi:hypothetical protein